MTLEFLGLIGIGFLAQLVDGALGMAFGLISTSALLSLGIPPAHASAAVHTAEVQPRELLACPICFTRTSIADFFSHSACPVCSEVF